MPLETTMRKLLILSTLALTLAACSTGPKPTEVKIYITSTYSYAVSSTETVVAVRPGKTGTQFCYTDSRLAGVQVCNNLATGTRTVPSGYDLGVVFTEPDAPATSPAPPRH
jgi:hypothetical protein